jgi:hypothetical protein
VFRARIGPVILLIGVSASPANAPVLALGWCSVLPPPTSRRIGFRCHKQFATGLLERSERPIKRSVSAARGLFRLLPQWRCPRPGPPFEHQMPQAFRTCSGVWPVRLRKTLAKWEASEKPARRPISAVVTRSKSDDRSMRTATSTRACISTAPKVSPQAASVRCSVRVEMLREVAISAACNDASGQRCLM